MNRAETAGWGAAFGILSVAIIVSNCVIIFVFTRRQFKRKRSYYLLINLAVTDLMVGMIALPSYIGVLVASRSLDNLYIVYLVFDITAGLTSVFSIALISLERLYAIGWPLKHLLLKGKHYIIGITLTWLYGIVVMILFGFVELKRIARAHLTVCAIGAPLLMTVVSYIVLYRMRKRSQANVQRRDDSRQDSKLVQTLLIVSVLFFLTWMPFGVVSSVISYSCSYEKCLDVDYNVINFTKLLHYSNSFVNAIIYALRIAPFRAALMNIFNPRRGRRTAPRVEFPTPGGLQIQELGIQNYVLETHL